MRRLRNRSILGVCEDFEGKRKVAFKRGQRELAHFAERSNQKELNAKITLLDNFNLLLSREAHILGQGYGIVEPCGYGIGIDLNPAYLRLQDVQNRRLPLTIGVGAD